MNQKKQLADFVRSKIKANHLSYRKVADRSGSLITHTTVSDVVNRKIENPSSETLQGLAKGLNVPEDQIFAIVTGRKSDGKSDVKRDGDGLPLSLDELLELKIRAIVRDELAGRDAEWSLVGQFLNQADDFQAFSDAVMKFIEEKSK